MGCHGGRNEGSSRPSIALCSYIAASAPPDDLHASCVVHSLPLRATYCLQPFEGRGKSMDYGWKHSSRRRSVTGACALV